MGKIITSPRYVIDITRTDPLSLGGVGGRVNLKAKILGHTQSGGFRMKLGVKNKQKS